MTVTKAVVALAALLVTTSSEAAVKYIIPVYGVSVAGADGTYSTSVAFTNASAISVTVRTLQILPLLTQPCIVPCDRLSAFVVPAHDTHEDYGSFFPAHGEHLVLGAVVFEADEPLQVEAFAHRDIDPRPSTQVEEIANEWIPAGVPSTLYRAIDIFDGTVNLFLINAGDTPASFRYWVQDYFIARTTIVAPHSVQLVSLGPDFYCPPGYCISTGPVFGQGLPIHIVSDAPYLAAFSSRSLNLPPVVRISRPD